MKNFIVAISAIALSGPAIAQMEPQQSGTPSAPQTSGPVAPTTMPSTPGQTMPMPESAATPTTPTVVTAPSDPKALIASEFPAYDKNADGNLDKTEFASWMGALRAKTDAKPMATSEMTKWSDGAFATADKDKSKAVSLTELQTYLTQGA